MGIADNKKAPQKRGLVMLVGRARFELATNGLKGLVRRWQTQSNTEILQRHSVFHDDEI